MAKDDSFRKAIEAANSGKRFPVMALVREAPEFAALMSKLVPPLVSPNYGNEGERTLTQPNLGMFQNTSQETSQNITDAQTVLQILPDMELATQILVSSVLSPKDMMTTELTHTVTEGLLAPEVSAAMLAVTRSHFEQDYKIKPLLGKILRDILSETGSWVAAVIPENSLDEVINGQRRVTLEALADVVGPDGSIRPKGLLGPAYTVQPREERKTAGFSLEMLQEHVPDTSIDSRVTLEGLINQGSAPVDTFLSVTDNPDLLKIPQIHQKIREQRIVGAIRSKALTSLGWGMESRVEALKPEQMSDRHLTGVLYGNREYKYRPITTMKTQEQLNRRAVGNPLVLHLPSESVIPVHVPGCPEAQVGVFVLIDADGNPVTKADNTDYYRELSSRLTANASFPSAMLTKLKGMMGGFNPHDPRDLDYSARAYGEMVEKDLLARLRNGVYGKGVAVAKREEIYRIMFARALAKQHTQLLFLPSELVTYMALKYTPTGIGKSLMDDMKILNSLRSMVLFSNVMASLRNSIGRTEVKLKLDESDPNPQKTIEVAMHEIIKSRSAYFPLGMNRPTDLVDYLQRAAFEFSYEGHPGMPDVKVDFGEKNTNYVKPDTDLEDSLRKRSIMGLGLSPETVDAGFTAEFATSVLNNNILLSKRVMHMQEIFTPQLSDHLRKVMMNSESLVSELREILKNNFDKLEATLKDSEGGELKLSDAGLKDEADKDIVIDGLLREFILNYEVQLPQPNTVTLENQLIALKTYSEGLDATLEAYVSEKFFTTDTGGEVANQVAVIKEVLKAYFIRQWLAENGVMNELSALTTLGTDGNPAVNIFDAQKGHLEALGKSLTDLLKDLQPSKEKNDKVIDGLTVSDEPAATPSDTGGGGNDFDFGGGDDTGGGTDTGTTEEPASGQAPAEGAAPAGGEDTTEEEEPAEGADKTDEEEGGETPAAS